MSEFALDDNKLSKEIMKMPKHHTPMINIPMITYY